MYIMNMLLSTGSLVIIVTCVGATDNLSSEQLHAKNLAKRFVKLLESEIQTCVTLASSSCKKELMVKQLGVVQQTLSVFEFELTDCFTSSQEYTGKRNTTKSGLVCQNWNSRVPHEHPYYTFPDGSVDNAGNYCRDPRNTGTLWCLTVDPKTRSEDCNVRRCDTF